MSSIDDIDWHALSHAYGDASDVPGLLRQLQSPDEDERRSSLDSLFTNIWHQGTVYEATVQALPFLIDMLDAGGDALLERESIALLVANILSGHGYYQVHYSREIINPLTGQPARPPADLDERIASEDRIVAEIRRRGRRAVTLLLPYLEHEYADVRQSMAEALAGYSDFSDSIVPFLEAALATERDDDTREAMQAALAALTQGPV